MKGSLLLQLPPPVLLEPVSLSLVLGWSYVEYMEYMKMGTQLAFLFVVAYFFRPFGSQEDTACAFFLWYPLLRLSSV